MIIRKYIELEDNYFLDKPNEKHPMWEAIILCWIVKIIKRRNQKEFAQRKRWVHSLEAPTKKMVQEEVAKFSKRRDVKLLRNYRMAGSRGQGQRK